MSEMVERVARAIYPAIVEDTDFCGLDFAQMWQVTMYTGLRTKVEAAARLAIEAMRKPTPAMLKAAEALGDDYHNASAERTWPVMIDAALGQS